MSHSRTKTAIEKLFTTRSIKSFAAHFLLNSMAGQKLFLMNERLPRVINISFNEKTCMFSCSMCPYAEDHVREMYRGGSEMDFDTFKAIVHSIPNDPFYSFDISSIGETLQFKPVADFIAYAKKHRPLVNTIISTNALLLSEDVMRALVSSGLDAMQLSMYAENAEDHQMITKTRSFDRVCENVRRASEVRREMGSETPYLQAFMMDSKETHETTERFIETWSQYVDQAFVRPIYNLGREVEGLTPLFEATPSAERYPCITPWYSTAIRSNGDVLPCYMFHWYEEAKDLVVGNINDATLEEIWASDRFAEFRDAHRRLDFEKYPVCSTCDLWDAYTDVWTRTPDGGFEYSRLRPGDFLEPAPESRGA
ncbi:MAG: SPASM domain-containing protein [Myxococcota bacterium]|nr:SPASM domain-containing protein [Myxococcota bacterium]